MGVSVKRCLLSVHDKTGLEEFARALHEAGCEILSSGGTYRFLTGKGIPAVEVSSYTGSPEVMGGRVKTLHPKIHGGILFRRGLQSDEEGLAQIGGGPIDLVVVNLYPFEQVSSKDPADVANVIENIDIGGPALVRSAAKNFAHVGVVVDPDDYARVLSELADLTPATRLHLARRAFERVEAYDRAISAYFCELVVAGESCKHEAADSPGAHVTLHLTRATALRYGENPHQKAALYTDSAASPWRQLQGKEISYNNWLDADAAWKLACEFDRPVCAIVKHNNPCGIAEAGSYDDAWRRALECDPVSAFGGIVAINGAVDGALAGHMAEIFLEVVVAAGFDAEALDILSKKKGLRLLHVPEGYRPAATDIRSIGIGYLVQDSDKALLDERALSVATERKPTDAEMEDLIFAWKVAKHVKSNAIVIAKDKQAIGIGAGQMSRVDSVRLAVMRSRKDVSGGALASDAFFPFADGVEEAAKSGVSTLIQPGGSVRDHEVIAVANRLGLAMVLTGMRHFRH